MQEFSELKNHIDTYNNLKTKLEESHAFLEICREEREKDIPLIEELSKGIEPISREIENFDLETLFSSPHDRQNVFLTVQAGAGGTDACDWAQILLRMYTRWFDKRGLKYSLVDSQFADEAGIRNTTLYVEGTHVFGNLKSEIGVHRLVRISPFNVSHKRHTSFASVDVVPEAEISQVELKEADLEIQTFKAGGPGGQHVNKTESGIRITHVPTGILVSCRSERSQHINRSVAMQMLASKLERYYEAAHKKELKDLLGEKGEISFGSQIRSYVLHPYTLVKDHRTNHEEGNVQGVLDGDIDPFITKFLRWPKRTI